MTMFPYSFLFFFHKVFFLNMYVNVLLAYICVCCALGGQKNALESLKLGLQLVVKLLCGCLELPGLF